MAEVSVAADMLQSFVRRIESLDDEILAMNADKSEVYKEAKGNGFDVKVLRKLIADRRKDASERAEFETIYELYAEALGMRLYRDEGDKPTLVRAHVENIDEFDAETGEITEPQPETAVQMRAAEGVAQTSGGPIASLAGAEGIADQHPIHEQQPAPAARDLTVPQALTGQVANHTPEMAQPVHSIEGINEPKTVADDANAGGLHENSVTADPIDTETAGATPSGLDIENTMKGDGPSEASVGSVEIAAPLYAEAGMVAMERNPPEPVKRHAYSAAWAEVGQDITKLRADVHAQFGGVRDPITKIGCEILDGWARYNISRSMLIDYPVVQYGGADPLMDCIAWNLLSRELTLGQKKLMAGRLTKLEPARAGDIYSMFGLAEAQEAAQ